MLNRINVIDNTNKIIPIMIINYHKYQIPNLSRDL